MRIKGLQKITLLDYPGVIACIVFTGGCNMRCPFCHNASLVTHISPDDIKEEDFFSFLKSRMKKLDGVCITGGEPCIQKDLKEFIKKIKELGFLVKLDTNGSFPEILKELLDENLLDYVAMDIKNSFSNYEKTAGVKINLDNIKESIELLKTSGIPHEFRTTVVKELHSKEDLLEITKMVAPSPLYFQQFIDSGDLISDNLHAHEETFLKEVKDSCCQISDKVYIRGVIE